jgi:hypothetical protein
LTDSRNTLQRDSQPTSLSNIKTWACRVCTTTSEFPFSNRIRGTGQSIFEILFLGGSRPPKGVKTVSKCRVVDGNTVRLVCQQWRWSRSDYAASSRQSTPFRQSLAIQSPLIFAQDPRDVPSHVLSTSSRPLTSRLISSLYLQDIHYVTYKSGVRFIVFRLGTLRFYYNEPSGLIQIPAKLNGRSAELSRGHPCLPHTGSLTPGPAHIRRCHRFGTCQNWT